MENGMTSEEKFLFDLDGNDVALAQSIALALESFGLRTMQLQVVQRFWLN